MPLYLCILAYDGTLYAGWQKQIHKKSIQNTLESTFKRVFKCTVECFGASRTDAGVHALGQAVVCKTALNIDTKKLMQALNNSLPADIFIRKISRVSALFNIHRSVISKTYQYHIFRKRPMPFFSRYGWYWPYQIDKEKLEEALQCFVGTHQFDAFCSADDSRIDKIRTIDSISLSYISRYHAYRITVKGKKFLHHMIRRIVGAAVQVASNPIFTVNSIKESLHSCRTKQSFLNAPAQGLLLHNIIYTKEDQKK